MFSDEIWGEVCGGVEKPSTGKGAQERSPQRYITLAAAWRKLLIRAPRSRRRTLAEGADEGQLASSSSASRSSPTCRPTRSSRRAEGQGEEPARRGRSRREASPASAHAARPATRVGNSALLSRSPGRYPAKPTRERQRERFRRAGRHEGSGPAQRHQQRRISLLFGGRRSTPAVGFDAACARSRRPPRPATAARARPRRVARISPTSRARARRDHTTIAVTTGDPSPTA